jgi:hypothetical protein
MRFQGCFRSAAHGRGGESAIPGPMYFFTPGFFDGRADSADFEKQGTAIGTVPIVLI